MSMENPLSANERLREERLRRGWSQQKLADELGIAVVTVNRWERGKQQPTGYYRLKLITLFEKSAEELGLAEEQTGGVSPISDEEQQERGNTVIPIFMSVNLEETNNTTSPAHETVAEQSSLEREMAQRPLTSPPYAYARSAKPSLNKRGKIILLLLALILLIIAAPITFVLLHSRKSSVIRTPSSSIYAPFTPPSTWKETLDPLTKTNHNPQWVDDGSQCIFRSDGYYGISQGTNYCNFGDSSANNFPDIAYSVDIVFHKGNMGGLVFRLVNDNYYGFYITTTGTYQILTHSSANHGDDNFLISKPSAAIRKGLQQKNTLSVLAQGTSLKFWINGQPVAALHNATYTEGTIGTFVGNPQDDSNAVTEAVFRNAKVWTP